MIDEPEYDYPRHLASARYECGTGWQMSDENHPKSCRHQPGNRNGDSHHRPDSVLSFKETGYQCLDAMSRREDYLLPSIGS